MCEDTLPHPTFRSRIFDGRLRPRRAFPRPTRRSICCCLPCKESSDCDSTSPLWPSLTSMRALHQQQRLRQVELRHQWQEALLLLLTLLRLLRLQQQQQWPPLQAPDPTISPTKTKSQPLPPQPPTSSTEFAPTSPPSRPWPLPSSSIPPRRPCTCLPCFERRT